MTLTADRVVGAPARGAAILSRAAADAQACGVTRLADVTRLDTLGVHVFQAVRPLGRTVAVHQGKALAQTEAMIGALMEAVECDHAETYHDEAFVRAFDALAADERPAALGDYAAIRDRPPPRDAPLAWVAGRRLLGGGRLMVPFDLVSLDLSRPGHPGVERSSTGLAARYDLEGAQVKGLQEVIERDTQSAWSALPIERRTVDGLETQTIPYPWFRDLLGRIEAAGLSLTIYQPAAVIRIPVILAEILEPGAGASPRRRALGLACRAEPEDALRASVLEAAQARLTAISGVRDDILYPERPWVRESGCGVGLPPPAHIIPRRWDDVLANTVAPDNATSEGLAWALARAGYPDTAVVDLTRNPGGAIVVKVVAPGLGAFGRGRRPA